MDFNKVVEDASAEKKFVPTDEEVAEKFNQMPEMEEVDNRLDKIMSASPSGVSGNEEVTNKGGNKNMFNKTPSIVIVVVLIVIAGMMAHSRYIQPQDVDTPLVDKVTAQQVITAQAQYGERALSIMPSEKAVIPALQFQEMLDKGARGSMEYHLSAEMGYDSNSTATRRSGPSWYETREQSLEELRNRRNGYGSQNSGLGYRLRPPKEANEVINTPPPQQ